MTRSTSSAGETSRHRVAGDTPPAWSARRSHLGPDAGCTAGVVVGLAAVRDRVGVVVVLDHDRLFVDAGRFGDIAGDPEVRADDADPRHPADTADTTIAPGLGGDAAASALLVGA